MRFASYLRAALPPLAFPAAALALAAFVLSIAGVSPSIVIVVCALVVAGAALALGVDWARKRRFYDDLETAATGTEHPLWLTEMIDRPEHLEGAIAHDALRAIAKAANDDVAESRRQLEDYREFVETWVHEAKSPLAAAHLMLDNMRDDAAPGDGEGRLARLDGELRRVEGYIDQALFYARSETLDRDYLIRRYTVRALVSDALRANAPTLIEAHATPVLGELDFEVFTDEKWIAFILGQVIQNSVKYAPADGLRISFDARLIGEGTADERVELAVADNGCGVTEADLPRVFDKGFTGENGRTGKRATGIGLYLVKRLCDKMGVGVTADSVPGAGFTVAFSFSTNRFRFVD